MIPGIVDLRPAWQELIAKNDKGRASHSELPLYWAGEPLLGKRVLYWAAEGIGDEILYASMLPGLISIASHVTIETELRLIPVFQRSFPQATVVSRGQGGADHDVQISAPQLGLYLRPDVSKFTPYIMYLKPSEATRNLQLYYMNLGWMHDICGIAWRSANRTNGDVKSAFTFEFDELFKRADMFVASVQYGEVTPEVAGTPIHVHPFIDQVESLDDAFAQIAAMDLVITTSNTAAHIAGALGKKTYLLLPDVAPERLPWYWGAGETSIWYPNTKIFRGEGEHWCRTALSQALKQI